MTTIITRLYKDRKTADGVASQLADAGFRARDYDVIDGSGGHVAERLSAAKVPARSAEAYAGPIGSGNALVVVRAEFNPRGAALMAREIVDGTEWIDAGVAKQDVYLRVEPELEMRLSILRDHRRFLSSDMDPERQAVRRRSASSTFGIPLLSKHRETRSAKAGGGYMTAALMPLLSHKERRISVLPEGGPILSSRLGWPVLSHRD